MHNDWNRSRSFEVVPRIVVRPTSALAAELGIRWNANKDDAQWIDTIEHEGENDRYLFGRLNQNTVAITTRVNYTITPNLSLQLYGEPFVSSGHYEHYKELVAGRAARHADRYAPFAHTEDEDFSVLSFRTTNVLRWEFKPGSTFSSSGSRAARAMATRDRSALAATSVTSSPPAPRTPCWSSSRIG